MQNNFLNNQIVNISMAEADAFAMEYFMKICGLHREGEKYRRMQTQGFEARERILDQVDIKAVVSSFPGNTILGGEAVLNGISFACKGFQQLEPVHTRRIYAYVLTAGTFELDDNDPIMEQLFRDVWGTAYVDAGRDVLKQFVEADLRSNFGDEGITVSDSFGPGFYGMEVTEVGKFFELLEPGKIGITVRNNSLMLPLKSCSGFFVGVDNGTRLPSSDCKSCRSEQKNCAFCQAVFKRD